MSLLLNSRNVYARAGADLGGGGGLPLWWEEEGVEAEMVRNWREVGGGVGERKKSPEIN